MTIIEVTIIEVTIIEVTIIEVTIIEVTIIEVVFQPPTPEAKVESDAPPAVITTQPAQPMPEHDDSIAVVMWESTVTGSINQWPSMVDPQVINN